LPADGALWLAVDDGATVFLNGKQVAQKIGWANNAPVKLDAGLFHLGKNVIAVEASNGGGPAGILLRLDMHMEKRIQSIVSDSSWVGFATKPEGWPTVEADKGVPVTVVARADQGAARPMPWPSMAETHRIAGTPLDATLVVSTPISVEVTPRQLQRPPHDSDHLIAIQWEEWFTPFNAFWQTAHAVPLMGFYDSRNPDVARQHLIWMVESGVDCVIADWSNNIVGAPHFQPGPGVLQLIEATVVMMEQMIALRAEGQPVPKMTILAGISSVKPEVRADKEQLDYIHREFVANPRYAGLWQQFDGKPLVLVLDLGGSYLRESIKLDERFTLRFMGVTHDVNRDHERGLWSWMDWKTPMLTRHNDRAEGMTVSVGSFGPKGWCSPDARGRRNGATFIEDWREAMKARPRFLQVHQFQEFAGQVEGKPAIPPDIYLDSYSPELSDDIEPTSLTAHAYRGQGGWGFYALNLLRALVDLYRQPVAETTVVAISSPLHREVVRTSKVAVQWVEAGKPSASYTFFANGCEIARDVKGSATRVDLSAILDGPVTLHIVAEGTRTRYRLDWSQEATPLAQPEPASMEVVFTLEREAKAK